MREYEVPLFNIALTLGQIPYKDDLRDCAFPNMLVTKIYLSHRPAYTHLL